MACIIIFPGTSGVNSGHPAFCQLKADFFEFLWKFLSCHVCGDVRARKYEDGVEWNDNTSFHLTVTHFASILATLCGTFSAFSDIEIINRWLTQAKKFLFVCKFRSKFACNVANLKTHRLFPRKLTLIKASGEKQTSQRWVSTATRKLTFFHATIFG